MLPLHVGQWPSPIILAITAIVIPALLSWIYARFLRVPAAERPVTFIWHEPEEARKEWTGREIPSPSIHAHLDDPDLLPSEKSKSGRYITCYDPSTSHHLLTYPSPSHDEIREMISKSEVAQKSWAESSWSERRRVLRSLLKWVVEDMEAIARISARDTGKTMIDAAFGEILTTAEKLRWLIENGEKVLSPEFRSTNLLLAHKVSRVQYESVGVTAAIVSWNYPFHNLLSPIIASLTAGNSIVIKPSELVTYSSLHYLKAVRSCFEACGHSPDLVQGVLACEGEAAEALTGDERIGHLTFIGSERVGRLVAKKAGEAGTQITLELGGKDPAILLPSADLKYFADTFMRATFQAAGQNCIGIERFIVHESIYDKFVAEMEPRIRSLRVGCSVYGSNIDVGAMVSDRLFEALESLISRAVDQGARLLVGGKRYQHPSLTYGQFFEPTLLVDVRPEMELAREELFAPVMTVIKYKTLEEACEIANGTQYGLGSAVFGRSKSDCDYVTKRLRCGMVAQNDFATFYLNQALPFGGVRGSGFGRFGGPEGLRALCSPKAVTEDRLHGLVQTAIPPLLAYPIKNGKASWSFVSGLVNMAYGSSWAARFRGVWKLATAGTTKS